MFDGWQISMLMVLTMMMIAMAMSKKQNTSLPLFLCCAASTPEPGAGVTWASSRVLSLAPSAFALGWAAWESRSGMALHDIPRA